MIITDSAPPSPSKRSTPLPHQPILSDPPPAYGATSTQTLSQSRFIQAPAPAPVTRTFTNPPKSAGRRFFQAFAVALLIWLLILSLTRSIELNLMGQRFSTSYPIPPGVTIHDCIQGEAQWTDRSTQSGLANAVSTYRYHARTQYELPLSSDTLFLVAHGSLSNGNVKIVTSPVLTDVVHVELVVQYHNDVALDHVKVCRLQKHGNKNGVGIFSPSWWGYVKREDKSFFNVIVTIPETSNIKAFETDMSNYSHDFGDLHGRVHFDNLALTGSNGQIAGDSISFKYGSLRSSNAAIVIRSLLSENATVYTSNGPITGHYTSSTDLTLRTSNAPIQVEVTFGVSSKSATFEAITSNGPVGIEVTALSPISKITARSSNGPLTIDVKSIPVASTLDFSAHTSNNIASAKLPAEYEGSFTLRTSNSSPQIKKGSAVDPEGRRRRREIVVLGSTRGTASGNIYWDQRAKDRGKVEVISSNAPLTLEL